MHLPTQPTPSRTAGKGGSYTPRTPRTTPGVPQNGSIGMMLRRCRSLHLLHLCYDPVETREGGKIAKMLGRFASIVVRSGVESILAGGASRSLGGLLTGTTSRLQI